MNKEMVAEIYVSFHGKPGAIATGYPVAPKRILTARHVMYPKSGEQPASIEVRWHSRKDKPGGEWLPAELIDCGLDPTMDVALLELEFPEGFGCDCRLLATNPKKELQWESDGFAHVGRRDDKRPPTALAGDVYSVADDTDWLALTEKGKVAVPESWKGISGAPVFEQDSNTIVGIIVACPPGFDAGRLAATPTWKLLQCEGFKAQVQPDRDHAETLRVWFSPLFINTLKQSANVTASAPQVFNDLGVGISISTLGDLPNALLNSTPAQRVAFVDHLYQSLGGQRSVDDNAALHNLALLMMCVIFPQHKAVTTIIEARTRGDAVIHSGTADDFSTEVAKAAAEGAKPSINYCNDRPVFPYNIRSNKRRSGISDHHRQAITDITTQLSLKSIAGDAHGAVEGVWTEIYKRGGAGDMVANLKTGEEKLRALSRRCGKYARRFYVNLPENVSVEASDEWGILKRCFDDNLDLVKLSKNTDLDTVNLLSDLEEILLNTLSEQSNDEQNKH